MTLPAVGRIAFGNCSCKPFTGAGVTVLDPRCPAHGKKGYTVVVEGAQKGEGAMSKSQDLGIVDEQWADVEVGHGVKYARCPRCFVACIVEYCAVCRIQSARHAKANALRARTSRAFIPCGAVSLVHGWPCIVGIGHGDMHVAFQPDGKRCERWTAESSAVLPVNESALPANSHVTQAHKDAARVMRELAAGLHTGGIVLLRSVGTDEVRLDKDIVDELLGVATLLDGKTLEEAGAEIA